MTAYPADLHLHSVFSDGLRTPGELVQKAVKLRLRWIALCDHDTLAGLPAFTKAVSEARAAGEGNLRGVPSIELSAGAEAKTHLLGYGVDPEHPGLVAYLSKAAEQRALRIHLILERLEQLGVRLSPESADQLRRVATSRAHIARALIAQGEVHTVQQAFDRYLAVGKSAYVPRVAPSALEITALIRQAGGVPVLAHPCRLKLEPPALTALLDELRQAGLEGLEVWHPSTGRRDAAWLEAYARSHGLLVTGGSDYHGDRNTRVAMGRMPSGWRAVNEDAQALLNRVAASYRR